MVGRTGVVGIVVCPGAAGIVGATALGDRGGDGDSRIVEGRGAELATGTGADVLADAPLETAGDTELAIAAATRW